MRLQPREGFKMRGLRVAGLTVHGPETKGGPFGFRVMAGVDQPAASVSRSKPGWVEGVWGCG